MSLVLTSIVSGGQTGADRGGLDAAIALDIGWGGWAPLDWRADDGVIPEIYRAHMRQSGRRDYGLRTRLNLQDSDGTLIISFASELSGGSAYTAKQAKSQRKPCKHLVLPARGETSIRDGVRDALLEWVRANRIGVLNVAGPREAKEPGIQAAVRDALVWVFERVVPIDSGIFAAAELEIAAAQKVADEDDERMARAARGEPFWRQGPPAVDVVGLTDFIPRKETE